jgi:chromosome segregation ATPase
VTEEERLSEELKETIEAMNHEIIDLRVEISDLQNQLTSSETDKDELYNEVQALNQLVTQKEVRFNVLLIMI